MKVLCHEMKSALVIERVQGVMVQRWHSECLLGGRKEDRGVAGMHVNTGDAPSEHTGAVSGVCENTVRWGMSCTA